MKELIIIPLLLVLLKYGSPSSFFHSGHERSLDGEIPFSNMRIEKIINKNEVILICNVSLTEKEYIYQLEWIKDNQTVKIIDLDFINSPTKKNLNVKSYLRLVRAIYVEGIYYCLIRAKNKDSGTISSYATYTTINMKLPREKPTVSYAPWQYRTNTEIIINMEETPGMIFDICKPSPCFNKGICAQVGSSTVYKCICHGTGFYGKQCESKCKKFKENSNVPSECINI